MPTTYKVAVRIAYPKSKKLHNSQCAGLLHLYGNSLAVVEVLAVRIAGKVQKFAPGKITANGSWTWDGDTTEALTCDFSGPYGAATCKLVAKSDKISVSGTGKFLVPFAGRKYTGDLAFAGKGEVFREIVGLTPDPVDPDPKITLTWRERLARPWCLIGAPSYYWTNKTEREIDAILDDVLASGLDGVHFELVGPFAVDEYNKQPRGGSFADIITSNINKLDYWIRGIRKRDLICEIVGVNTNQSKAARESIATHERLARLLVDRVGSDNVLVLPYSETDNRTPDNIRQAWYRVLVSYYGKATIGYDKQGPGGYRETHPSRLSSVKAGGEKLVICSDSGGIIGDLYGSGWRDGGTPNISAIEDFGRRCRGSCCVLYSFAREVTSAEMMALARGYGAGTGDKPDVPPTDERGISWELTDWNIVVSPFSVSISGGTITFNGDRSAFKPWKASNGKTIDGVCFIGIPDGRGGYDMTSFEFIRRGDNKRPTSTVEPGHLNYDWKPTSGQRYPFAIANGGRGTDWKRAGAGNMRTPIAWAVWP